MAAKVNRKKNLIAKLSLFLPLSDLTGEKSSMGGKKNQTFSDQEILDGFIRGDVAVFSFLREKSLPLLIKIVDKPLKTKMAEQIIQDTFVVIYRKIKTTGLELHCRFLTYFMAVARKIWLFESNPGKINGAVMLSEEPCDVIDERELETLWMESMEFRLYRRHFSRFSEKQQKILMASMDGVPYKELFEEFGYKNVDTFKNEVSRIKRKLTERITADPVYLRLKNRNTWSYDGK